MRQIYFINTTEDACLVFRFAMSLGMVIASKNHHELVDDENMASVIEGDVEFVLFDRSKYTDFIQNGLTFDSLGSYLLTYPSTNEYMGSISAVGNNDEIQRKAREVYQFIKRNFEISMDHSYWIGPHALALWLKRELSFPSLLLKGRMFDVFATDSQILEVIETYKGRGVCARNLFRRSEQNQTEKVSRKEPDGILAKLREAGFQLLDADQLIEKPKDLLNIKESFILFPKDGIIDEKRTRLDYAFATTDSQAVFVTARKKKGQWLYSFALDMRLCDEQTGNTEVVALFESLRNEWKQRGCIVHELG